MSTHPTQESPMPPADFFDQESSKGWQFFIKFLGVNILVWGGVLVLLAVIYAVWK